MRLFNRLKYGKSDKPIYIKKEQRWLYKNKWYNLNGAIKEYTNNLYQQNDNISYSYIMDNNSYITNDFNDLVNQIILNPNITITNWLCLTKNQCEIIKSIKKHAALQELTKYSKIYADFQEKLDEINKSLNNL